MKKFAHHLLLGAALGAAFGAHAQGASGSKPVNRQFGNFQGDGYYWYKQDPEPEEVKPEKPPVPTPAPAAKASAPKQIKPMSSEWLRENLPKLMDLAVDNPTKENVANYMYAQRILLDKAQNFSEQVKTVVATDPFLDENNRMPLSQFAQAGFARGIGRAEEEALKFVAGKAGLWVFVDTPDKCSACATYASEIIQGSGGDAGVAKRYNFNSRVINVSTRDGLTAARKLGLSVTPTTVLVVPPRGIYVVSQGLMSQSQLKERILIAAKSTEMLPQAMLKSINPYSNGILSTAEINSAKAHKDPSEVIKQFRMRLQGPQ